MRLTTVALALLACGCGPSEGDFYEDVRSGERVQISTIGPCGDEYAKAERAWERLVGGADNEPARRSLILSTPAPVLHLGSADSSAVCFGFVKKYRPAERAEATTLLELEPIIVLDDPTRFKRLD